MVRFLPSSANPHHHDKTWQDIVERVIKERDSVELIDALDEQTTQQRPEPKPVDSTKDVGNPSQARRWVG